MANAAWLVKPLYVSEMESLGGRTAFGRADEFSQYGRQTVVYAANASEALAVGARRLNTSPDKLQVELIESGGTTLVGS